MGLFLYQWGQALFLQNACGMKNMDIYPGHLASMNVELMSSVTDHLDRIEKKLWDSAAGFAEPLEYTGEKYRIVVPHCPEDLVQEAYQQASRLGTYESRILSLGTRIVFLRYADDALSDRSLVTIEVDNDGNVLKCRSKLNRNPSDEIWKFILEWEKARSLTDITFCIPEEAREIPLNLQV